MRTSLAQAALEGLETRRLLAAQALELLPPGNEAVITGSAFYDRNADGVYDFNNDWPLENVTAYVDVNQNGVFDTDEPSDLTDSAGVFSIGSNVDGTVQVRVQFGGAYTQSTPVGGFTEVDAVSGQRVSAGRFGAWTTGGISGALYEDHDADGAIDGDDSPLLNGRVYADLNGSGFLDTDEPWSRPSVASGLTWRLDLKPGTYTFRVEFDAGYTQSVPTANAGITRTLTAGLLSFSNNFAGYTTSPVGGAVYNDTNGNGTRDTGEALLANRTIYVDANTNGVRDPGELFVTTTTAGNYSFNFSPGTHQIRQVLPAGYEQTQPTTAAHTVTTRSGFGYLAHFGSRQYGGVSGVVFNDVDGDGVKETGENAVNPLAWVYLDVNNDGARNASEPQAQSNAFDGSFTLNAPAGNYTLRVERQTTAWVHSPGAASRSVTVPAPGAVNSTGTYGLYRGGTLQGLTWNDKNNDGINNNGTEGNLTGRTVYIDANDSGTFDTGELSAVSGANGFSLVGVPIGTHLLRQVVPADWLHTAPSGTGAHSVTVASSQTINSLNFGTRYNFATIYGTIFEDVDNDGVQETGEGSLVGWTGYLDANNNNFLDSGELSGVSDQFGIFRIDNVTAGTHQLRVVPQLSWDQTLPAGFGVARSVTVAAGQADRSSVFGFWYDYNSISGTMFNDANANGVRDTGEGPLSGRTIFLDLNSDFALTSGEPTRVTDANGNYTFNRLLDGTYRVTLVQVPYWRQTPDLMYRSAQVARGEDEVNVNFSAVHVGRASGQLFNDANGNGVQDGGETTFTGFGVSAYLDLNGNSTWDAGAEPTSYTGGTGQFSFEMLPGTYTVRLKDLTAAGVRQTSPANNGGRTITIVAGQDATVASFGVQHTYAVQGQVFNDADADGVLDTGESLLSGRVVWADVNDNGSLDIGETQATTDSSGRYTFRLPTGTFRLRQIVPTGYEQTGRSATNSSATNTFASNGLVVVPTDTAWTPAPASPPAPSFNFGTRIVPVTRVYGYVIRDNNGNGVTDSGEPGNTPGDVVYVDANNNTALDAGEQQYTTDANGWFFNLPGGTYTIRQSLPAGWVQTMPSGSAGLTVNVPPTTPPNPIHAGFFGRYMLPPQNPFKGSPFAVGATPVTIQAEDYDLGGEGIAFHDTTPTTNSGGGYRTASGHGVDVKLISNTTNQYRLGDTFGGEWVEYTINVATSGQYTFDFRLSQADPNARMHAEIDGVDITGAITVPDTNNFSTFTTVSRTAFMTSGPHVLRLAFDAVAANGTVAGVDWVKITAASTTPPPQPPTGGTVTVNNSVAAYLRNGTYGNTNFGNDAQLIVKNSATAGNTRESYLKFDISTLPSDVTKISNVKLRLYGKQSASGTAVNVGAFAVVDTGWSETGITFNNKPPSATGSMATIRSISGTSNKWYEWDVTDYVKQQRMNGFTTIAIAMKATNATDPQALFNSDDASSNRPQLVATTSTTTTPPTTPQAIVIDNDALIVPEGGSKSFTVKLAAAPTSNVTVTISKQAGSQADVNADKSTLTFTPANWNVAQTVTLSAAEDADSVQNQSFFSVASTGLSTITVWAIESENDGPATEPTITIGESATVRDGTFATQNFGNGTEVVVKKSANAGNTRETYIRFDFSTVESVTTAKLRINARLSDTSVASLLTQIYSVSNTTWAETGITWNTKPTTGLTLRGSFTVSGTSATWYEIDLTSFIQAEFAAGRKVVTLVLRNPNTSDAQTLIPSDETPDGPQLVVG